MKKFNRIVWLIVLLTLPAFLLGTTCGDDDDDDDDNDDTGDDDDDDDSGDDDDDTGPTWTCFQDADLDTYGNPDVGQDLGEEDCPDGWVEDDSDCDDTDPLIHPGAVEYPDDGIDQDCDGSDWTRSDANGVFVSTSGSDSNPGTMDQPKRTIAAAIALADANEVSVFIAEGQYDENLVTTVSLFGGYSDGDWSRDIDTNVTHVMATGATAIRTAEGANVVIEGLSATGDGENASGISVNRSTAIIARCKADGGTGHKGIIVSNDSFATIVECEIIGGSVQNSRGVWVTYGSDALVLRNDIRARTVDGTSYGADVMFASATFVGNTISGEWGFHTYDSPATLINNVIEGVNMGVDFVNGSFGTLVNNTIRADGDDGLTFGLYFFNSSGIVLNNVIVNDSPDYSYAVNVFSTGPTLSVTLVNNDIYGPDLHCLVAGACNDLEAVNDCSWPSCQEAHGNITGNPLLHNPDDGDYHINGTSPCIDAGTDPNPWYTGTEPLWDFEGDPRPLDGDGNGSTEWDIGVDEYVR